MNLIFVGPLNIVVACGPFALVDELDYSPLQALLERINAMEPHVAILLGPFLDVRNKKVESGDVQTTYDDEFERIMNGLQTSINESIQVVIVPSWRDVHHQAVYPTGPFQRPKNCPARFHFTADPCRLDISGVSGALTSTDILLHLGKEEIALAPQGSDRMGRLASHILGQQSFYPLYPPAEEMSIDLQRWADYCYLNSTPHILILPSDLRHFVKNVDGCVVINPERTVKGSSGGTFARLQLDCREKVLKVKGEIVRV